MWDKQSSHRHSKDTLNPFKTSKSSLNLRWGGNKHLQKIAKGRPRGRQNETPKASKTAPDDPPESIGSNGQKKETGPPGFDKAPGGSNVTFSNVFSLSEHPPVSPVLGPVGIILGPDLVPVYMYIYYCLFFLDTATYAFARGTEEHSLLR